MQCTVGSCTDQAAVEALDHAYDVRLGAYTMQVYLCRRAHRGDGPSV
jgi:hypothetical protein